MRIRRNGILPLLSGLLVLALLPQGAGLRAAAPTEPEPPVSLAGRQKRLELLKQRRHEAARRAEAEGCAALAAPPAAPAPDASDPDLRLLSVRVDDAAGNNDGMLEPGETANLYISLSNFGSTAARSVYAQLNPGESNPYVTIVTKGAAWADIPAHGKGESTTAYQVQVSNVLPCGYPVELSLAVQCTGFSGTVPVRPELLRRTTYDLVADAVRRVNESDSVVYGSVTNEISGSKSAFADVNGDGYKDLVIGAQQASPGGKSSAGQVWLVYGTGAGLPANLDLATPPAGVTAFYGPDAGDFFGSSIASGDLNGDGYDDLVIGASRSRGAGNAKMDAGEVWVIYGQAAAFPATVNLAAPPAYAKVLYGADSGDQLGSGVGVGNPNGDGFDDLILGAGSSGSVGNGRYGAGEVWVIYGNTNLLPASVDLFTPPSYASVIYGAVTYDVLGGAVAAGDVDGDGYDDLILGAYNSDGPNKTRRFCGETWLVYGGSAALPATTDLASPPAYVSVFYGADAGDVLGYSVAAGDVNGDGYDDLVLGAMFGSGPANNKTQAGEGWIVYGQAQRFAAQVDLFTPPPAVSVVYAPDAGDNMGESAAAGDMNGDGFDDVAFGAYSAQGPGNARSFAGEAWLVYGGPAGLPSAVDLFSPPPFATVYYGPDASDGAGISVALGDVNADGMEDLMVGVYGGDGPTNARNGAGEAHLILGAASRTFWIKPETYSWIDATSGTPLSLACDDCSASLPVGFSFPYYGEKFSVLYVSSNGFLSFRPIRDAVSGVPRCMNSKSPSSLSSPGPVVAPLWDDLDLRSAGAVFSQLSGTAPNRRLTIEWLGVPHYPNTGTATFEVSLFESTGQILFQYQDVLFGTAADSGGTAVVGAQNRTGAEGVGYLCSQALLANAQAFSFNPTTPIFQDSMESLDTANNKNGKWTVTTTPTYGWHSNSGASCPPAFHGQTTSLYEGSSATCSYGGVAALNDTANLPQVSSFPADARLSYWQRLQSEAGFDLASVEIQGNGGGYTASRTQSGSISPAAWQYTAPIFYSTNGGQAVDLRFHFTVGDAINNNFLGWMVDDVKLTGCNAMGISGLVQAVAYAQPEIYCGDGVGAGLLDAVGSLCGDASPPTGYQWIEDGTPIPGATSPTYTIPAGHTAGAFDFACSVTCAGRTGTSAPQRVTIVAPPQAVGSTLRVTKAADSSTATFTWTDVAGATEYRLFEDTAASGGFGTATGSAPGGSPGLTTPMPTGSLLFYKVAGHNPTCGTGPK